MRLEILPVPFSSADENDDSNRQSSGHHSNVLADPPRALSDLHLIGRKLGGAVQAEPLAANPRKSNGSPS